MKVCKFGGTSIGSVERMKYVATLISESSSATSEKSFASGRSISAFRESPCTLHESFSAFGGNTPKIVVLSATSGTTDHLEKIAAHLFNRNIDQAHDAITRLEFKFIDFANELLEDTAIRRQAIDYLLERFSRIWDFARGAFTASDEKEIVAQGELISSALLSFYLTEQGQRNVLLSAFDFMRTGSEGEPDMEYIGSHLNDLLKQHNEIPIFITQGYICKNAYNETDNLKRGGSDYSATLIGAALQAEEIQIWTDIDGMHNNDPRIIEGTTPVRRLSFEEAERLAYFGAKILHPLCIAPAKEKNILVRLLNSMQPQSEGTLISDAQDSTVIKAIAAKDSVFFLKFESNDALRPYLFISKVFETFARHRSPFCLLTSSATDVSIATDRTEALPQILRELSKYALTTVEDQMSIISVVGNMKWQYAGFEARIMNALKDIPLRMIAYGSNNNDLSVVVRTDQKKKALQALNDALFQTKHAFLKIQERRA